ncbi:MAG TPA: hypothetical protein VNX28_04455 [Gemmataceae bacterium]|jgi:hypothetical protein|nr:hypothetical protein [Gemmataceae bacterium]
MKTTKTSRQFRPQLEQFEGRIVPSAFFGAATAIAGLHSNLLVSPTAVVLQQNLYQDVVFHGGVSGTWTVLPVANPVAGVTQGLNGSGTVAPLGSVQASGTVRLPVASGQGYAAGTMVLTGAKGTVTVALTGHQPQPGVSPPTGAFDFTISGGTGAYVGVAGKGAAKLTETPPDKNGVGTFTLTFQGIISMPTPTPSASGISGVALAGPISPLAHPGIPNDAPLAGAIITIQPANGGPEIIRVRADLFGRFKIALAPGTYLIVPLPPNPTAHWPRGMTETVVVKADGFTDVVVNYDTGIR